MQHFPSPKRVVITGMGLITPLGCSIDRIWSSILQGKSGIKAIEKSKKGDVPVHVMATVDRDDEEFKNLCESSNINMNFSSSSDFINLSMVASDIAIRHAQNPLANMDKNRAGVSIGSGMGSLSSIIDSYDSFSKSFKRLSPYFIPKVLINLAAGQVSIRHGLKGPNHATVTACAAGANAIGDAYNFIRLNYADVMIAGGAECSTDLLTRGGFARMRALSSAIDPINSSRPFDKSRDGFVIGEGAGILVLESLDNVKRRGAEHLILAELCGYGLSGDASHITSPCIDGEGAQRAMLSALRDAADYGICAADVGYINAHATSTPAGDAAETMAIDAVFSSSSKHGLDTSRLGAVINSMRSREYPLFVSSTKGATGHLLGAAGAVEAAITILALKDGKIPPTVGLESPEPTPSNFKHCRLLDTDHVKTAINESNNKFTAAMSNSFGFGGVNVSLLFSKYDNAKNE